MGGRTRLGLKLAGTVLLAALGFWLVSVRFIHFRRGGEAGAQVWFYDQQKKLVYAASRDAIPPEGQGVRAVVVSFPGEETEPAKRRVAYLETYGQPLKQALERAKSARSSGKPLKEPPPARASDLFRTNDLVKLVDETEWHPVGTPEGRRVMAEWRSWRAPDGREPVVCLP